jgi:hypothetical protein
MGMMVFLRNTSMKKQTKGGRIMQAKKVTLAVLLIALGSLLAYGLGQTAPKDKWGEGNGRDRREAAAVLVCNMPGATQNPNVVENISKSSTEISDIQQGDDCATAIARLLGFNLKLVEVRQLTGLVQLYVFHT